MISMPEQVSLEGVRQFREDIYRFYRDNKRDLPYRSTRDPYRVLVSEIMLQQTRVERVNQKFPSFIALFPDFMSLASAPLSEILRAWQGMGYNRRAKHLKIIAEKVCGEYAGILPADPAVLETFPGIGNATARSVCAFAYNLPVVFIETNIRRVFIHCFFPECESVSDREILPLVEITLDQANPRDWYYALMDYGTQLKTSVPNPNRRSHHYTRQPPFKGSDRQIRGLVLRIVLDEPGISEISLWEKTGCERERLDRILADLEKEQFIVRKLGIFIIT
jgi:A/G-specific adenine glycosylase